MLKWFVIKYQSDSWNSFDTGITNLQLSSFIWISKDLWQQISSYENEANHFFYWFSFCPLVKEVNENKEVMNRSASICFITFWKRCKTVKFTFQLHKLCLSCTGIGCFQFRISYIKVSNSFPFLICNVEDKPFEMKVIFYIL